MGEIFDHFAKHILDPIFLTYWQLAIPYFFIVFYPTLRLTKWITYAWILVGGLIYLGLIAYRGNGFFHMIYYHYMTSAGFQEIGNDSILSYVIYLQIITWDLMITYWVSLDSKRIGTSNLVRILFLLLLMNLPPAFLSIYLLYRFYKTRDLPDLVASQERG